VQSLRGGDSKARVYRQQAGQGGGPLLRGIVRLRLCFADETGRPRNAVTGERIAQSRAGQK